MRLSFPAAALAGAALLLAAGQAAAHAKLTASTPSADATVAATRTITLSFSETLIPAFSSFDLAGGDGKKIPVAIAVSKDGRTLAGQLRAPLAKGGYVVAWRAATADGHRMTGTFAFKVN